MIILEKKTGYGLVQIKAIDEEKRIVRGIASTPRLDRQGDIVDPMGAEYEVMPKLLLYHDHTLPVGNLTKVKKTKDGIEFEASIPEVPEFGIVRDRVNEAWHSLKYNLINAVSIGFKILEYKIMENGGWNIQKWEWLELSLVPIPAQADAVITGIKSIDDGLRSEIKAFKTSVAESGKKAGVEKALNASVDSEKKTKTVKISKSKKENEMKISEQLKQFRNSLAEKQTKLVALGEQSADETFDASAQEEFDTLAAEVEEVKGHIKRLEVAEKAAMASATPVEEESGKTEKSSVAVRQGVQIKREENLEKGIKFARYVMALAKAKGDHTKAFNIANQQYGEDSSITRVLGAQAKGADFEGMMKAAISAGSTITGENATWGSELVDFDNFVGDFLEYLRPQTIIGKFGVNGVPSLRQIPFNVKIKGQDGAATAAWVGQGHAKPVTSMGFNSVELGFYKVACIAVITEELIRFSNPSAERLVREELARAVIERLDIDFINPAKAAVAGVSPASILNGVTPIPSAGSDADAINCDLQALEESFINANNDPLNGVYIMRPALANVLGRLQNPLGQSMFPGVSMRGGTLNGTPVIVSNYVPDGIVALVNASDIYLADDGQVTVDASREATIQMDTAPTQDSVTPTPSTGVSMFQTNSVAIRAERYINWARRRDSGVAYLTDVAWSACAPIES